MSLALQGQAVAADGFWLMGPELALNGQTNWNYYDAGDSPEGAYMGWMYPGITNLPGSINLKRTLSPGRYYVLLKLIDYESGGHGKVGVSLGGNGAIADTSNDDWNKYWTTPVAISLNRVTTNLVLNLIKTIAGNADQRYLLRGIYITTNANENVPLYGSDRIVDYTYPTNMDNSPPARGNLIQNSGFEAGMGHGWGFLAETYVRENAFASGLDTNVAFHGKTSFRFPYKGSLISRIHRTKPNKRYTFSAWVRSENLSGIGLHLYNVGTAPPGLPAVQSILNNSFTTGPTWKRISISGDLWKYPHCDYQLLITANAGVWIDALQLEEGNPTDYLPASSVEIGFVSDRPGRILFEDENPRLDLVAFNSATQSFSGTVVHEIYDIFNRKVSSGETPISVSAGQRLMQPFVLPNGKRGIFRAVGWLKNVEATMEEVTYAVVPRPGIQGVDESSVIGVHPNFMPFQLSMHERLGFKWARAMSPAAIFRWQDIEPVEGQIKWYDSQVDQAAPHGMTIMGSIGSNDYWPAWADRNGMPDLDKWESFVERLVTHYKGKVKYWEIWNEPIYVFTPQFYAELSKRAGNAIRRADPSAKIVGMGGTYSKDWILQVMNLLGTNWNQYLDIIATHLYPAATDPSGGETDKRAIAFKREVIDRYGVEVWNTETGVWDEGFYKGPNSNFSTTGEPIWPQSDSERYVRGSYYEPERLLANFLHCLGNGLTKYFYYDSRIYIDPSYQKAHPTMLEYDDSIRSKGIAFSIAGHFLDRSRGLGNISTATNTAFAYLFDRSSKPVVVLWSEDKLNHSLRLSVSGWKVFDMMGNEVVTTNSTIRFGRAPLYVQSDSLSIATMRSAIQTASLTTEADTTPPNVSIDEFPTRGTSQGITSFRWLGIDETSVPSATEPSSVVYSFKLEGKDADWSAWTPRTHVQYTALSSGNYTFQVRGKDFSGNTSSIESRAFSVGTSPKPSPPSGLIIIQ